MRYLCTILLVLPNIFAAASQKLKVCSGQPVAKSLQLLPKAYLAQFIRAVFHPNTLH